MAIDDCQHTFEILASKALPGFMRELERAMQSPHQAVGFAASGLGVRSILRKLDRAEDFSGLYVFIEKSKPIYVGISRGVVARVRQHLTGRTHFDATLAFRMAGLTAPRIEGPRQRKLLMKNQIFLEHFEKAKKHLSSLAVAFVEIRNPVELYVFEVYAAMALDTATWNTFRTH